MEALVSRIKNKKALLAIFILFIASLLLFTYLTTIVSKDIIYPNIKVQGISVGKLTKDQGKEKLDKDLGEILREGRLLLSLDKRNWELSFNELGVKFDIEKSIEEAYGRGKEGNIFNKIKAYLFLSKNGEDIPLHIDIDKDPIKKIIDELAAEIEEKPIDGKIARKNGSFIITPERKGVSLDKEGTEALIVDKIKGLSGENIIIPIRESHPKITESSLKSIKETLAEFATKFKLSQKNRVFNLKNAADMINGKVILPGEIFSVYEMIGPVTKDKGYKDAPVIIGGQLKDDVGGGVCQIATNVYNAALRANLSIVERRHHGFPVSYVTIGQDATIAGDWIDMKFKNTLNSPIFIEMYLNGDSLITNIYGEKKGNKIELKSEITNEISPKIIYKKDNSKYTDFKKVEKESKKGYKVNVYKLTYDNGYIIKKELLHNDFYKPVDGIIVIGTREINNSESIKSSKSRDDMESDDIIEEY